MQASSLQYEMLLLTDSISKEDSCWELRLRCGEPRGSAGQWGGREGEDPENLLPQEEREREAPPSLGQKGQRGKCPSLGFWTDADRLVCSAPALSLFLMAVNIKTPVVVENITLMCLRILQKLIKPPAPTSKKNKVPAPLASPPLPPIPASGVGGRWQQQLLEALPDSLLGSPGLAGGLPDHGQALQQRNPRPGPAVAQEGPQGRLRGVEEVPACPRYASLLPPLPLYWLPPPVSRRAATPPHGSHFRGCFALVL